MNYMDWADLFYMDLAKQFDEIINKDHPNEYLALFMHLSQPKNDTRYIFDQEDAIYFSYNTSIIG